jgi:hypothetical protein
MFLQGEDKNFILANTAPKPIQAQMPLICNGFVPMLITMLPSIIAVQNHDFLAHL